MSDPTAEKKVPAVYLGDAVYASFDGFAIRLHLNHHESRPVIALEPEVYEQLQYYAERIWGPRL